MPFYTKEEIILSIEFDNEQGKDAKIVVIGVGGGGNNAIDRMIETGLSGVDFISMNTDKHVLLKSHANIKIQLGEKLTRGLGAGANPEIGEKAATESRDEIASALKGYDMVFITAGMGGGTGTGAAPIVAEVAKELGILTVGVVTKPFMFEGRRKAIAANNGIEKFRAHIDSLVVIPNDRILKVVDEKFTLENAFKLVDEVLTKSVSGIVEIITKIGDMNVDFADVKATMSNRGIVHMGVGQAAGKNRAEEALMKAINNPLLETSIENAKAVLINFCGDNINMQEMETVSNLVYDSVDVDAQIIIGTLNESDMNDEIKVTVIAAGFDEEPGEQAPAVPQGRTERVATPVEEVKEEAQEPTPAKEEDEDDLDIPPFLRR